MAKSFDVSPEKEGSMLNFFQRQLTQTPEVVQGVNLEGKTAIVTGSNVGVGLECSRRLLDLGLSKLVLAVRSEAKGQTALADLSKGRNLKEGAIVVWHLDHSSYDSVLSFVEKTKTLDRLDIVILNIGIMTTSPKPNPNTGHEETIQVNYLSMALLAILLLPVIKSKLPEQQGPSRITIVSSDASAWAKFKERNEVPLLPSFDRPGKMDMVERTFVSKLLGQFFLVELAKRVPPTVAIINASTPGMVHDSQISRDTAQTFSGKLAEVFRRRIGYTSTVGARMITDAAVKHGEETHGQYLNFQKVKPMAPIIYTAEGERIRDQLWKETMAEFSFAGAEDIIKDIRN
ncbi:NAD(P)-binding protein [Annulohypoxylon truncatum]|uniref:NAD(P)-binding protein n=1 Tax=Annulohypoxylon truncatum TaxID=327061 RepID=UPI00200820DE|nr:NAD(P)-binding protein [Annulohypoxylon truncatum]KAI1208145.1 NAD(P)-binding protein [Annulohypoxylon truncatum]